MLYDTETSEIIYVNKDNGRTWYKTKKGNYFLMYRTGEIVPKSEEDVKDFLGVNDVAKYIELFGKVVNA